LNPLRNCCDRYFESRPHLLGGGTADLVAAAAPAAASIQRTVADHPQAAANLVTAGARSFNKWNSTANSSAPVSIRPYYIISIMTYYLLFCRIPMPPQSVQLMIGQSLAWV
jgi:hypothetical protein